ncbi:hypothetical protein [Nostoc sp.]|uniref:hypothetical protein n=1 Tax=Nostoc sp. TaxID=1180 RepID=UPI002FF7E4AC
MECIVIVWLLKLRKLGIFYRPSVDERLNHYGSCQILIILSLPPLIKVLPSVLKAIA